MWFNLIKRGYTFVHAGCLSYRGKDGMIIAAPADTGKTSTILSLLSTDAFRFMSDDAALVGNGNVYAYPEKVKVSPYTLTGKLRVKRSLKRRFFKSRVLGLMSERLLKMKIADLHEIPEELVVDKNPLKKVFVIAGYNKKSRVQKIGKKLAARLLILPSAEFSTLMHRYIELYYYMFAVDTFKILEKMNKIVVDSFKNAECFVIQAPKLEGYAQAIMEVIE